MAKFEPHLYQEAAIQHIIKTPKCGLFVDMGLWQNRSYTHGHNGAYV